MVEEFEEEVEDWDAEGCLHGEVVSLGLGFLGRGGRVDVHLCPS